MGTQNINNDGMKAGELIPDLITGRPDPPYRLEVPTNALNRIKSPRKK
jgi:hypothetical protein